MSYFNAIGTPQSSVPQQVSETRKPELGTGVPGATKAPPAVNAAITNDQTSISPTSKLLSQALSQSDVRSEKVASLQQAIASGSYNVSSTDVAAKLLQSLLG